MAMVSNKFLASLAIKLEFHRHLRKNGTAMIHQIQSFAGEVMQAELEAEGANDFWKTVTGSIPKVLYIHFGNRRSLVSLTILMYLVDI